MTRGIFMLILPVQLQGDRNYFLKAKKHVRDGNKIDESFAKEMQDWFYSFSNYIEYSHEERDSLINFV